MKFVSSHFPTMKVGTQGLNMSRMAYNDIPSTENSCSYMSFVLYEFPCDMTTKFASSHFPTVKVGTQGFNMSRMAYNDNPSTVNSCSYMSFVLYEFSCDMADMTMKFVSSHFPTVKVGTQGFNMSRMAYNDIPSTENRLLIYVVRPVRISMLYDNEIRKLTFPHGESWHSRFQHV